MTSTPEPDPRLIGAHDLAVAALKEIAPESAIGEPAGFAVADDGVVSLRFASAMRGYPGWFWTVSLAVVDDAEPTVLEAELLPGDYALLAPEWIPWSQRLEEYKAAQAAADAEDEDAQEEDEDEDDELDEDGSEYLHSGDVDGVDIDEDDDDASDDDDADEDDD